MLIHCILVDYSTVIFWTSPLFKRSEGPSMSLLFYFDENHLANNVDPDQTPHNLIWVFSVCLRPIYGF